MFGLSFTHLMILGILALLVLGPEQLPEMARTLARLLNEWKRASSDIQSSLVNTFKVDLNAPPTPHPEPESAFNDLPDEDSLPPSVEDAQLALFETAEHEIPHPDTVYHDHETPPESGDDVEATDLAYPLPAGQVKKGDS